MTTAGGIAMPEKTALILGVTGQDGAYLAKLLLDKGYRVHGTSRDRETANLANLQALGIANQIALRSVVPTDFRTVMSAISAVEPQEVYNLSAQSSVALSFEQPVETIDAALNGTVNVLEAVRLLDPGIRVYSASSSECFGNLPNEPATEETPFRPCSPYGVAKAAAHWLVANYREAYGLFVCSGILFNHESPFRPARFVTQRIVRGALDIAEGIATELHLGNLSVARDWGYAPEYVDAMWRMLQLDQPSDFVIATGRAATLEDFVEQAFAAAGLDWRAHVVTDASLLRPLDIMRSVGHPEKARRLLGWTPRVLLPELIIGLVQAERQRRKTPA
jgi:GDPmannose 4,6-dehydratase